MNNDINIVRLSRGIDFVRFEIARGCSVATMHGSVDRPTSLDIDDARTRIARLLDAGWIVAAV